MIHSWQLILDTIFPPTEHELLLREYDRERFTRFLIPQQIGNVTALCDYREPAVKAAVAATKFEHNHHACDLLGAIVSRWASQYISVPTLIIPIPLSSKREKERGYNQVLQVLERVTPMADIPLKIANNILVRQRHTVPQTSLQRKERLGNLVGAFGVNTKVIQQYPAFQEVIICDDVTTTGATLETAKAALAPHLSAHVKVSLVAWAH